MTIEIVPFDEIYQNQVENLVLNIQNNEFHLGLKATDQPDLPNLKQFFETGGFWVALNQNEVVGTIGLQFLNSKQAILRKMFLAQSVRGNKEVNLAQRLYEIMLERAKEMGFEEIWLDTPPPAKAAHRFYERNGFEEMPISSIPEGFKMPKIAGVKIYRLNLQ